MLRKYLLLLCFCALALDPLLVPAQALPDAQKRPSGSNATSLLEFEPKAEHFSADLKVPAKLLEDGYRLVQGGNPAASISLFEQALKISERGNLESRTNADQLQIIIGLAQEQLGREKLAKQSYDLALKHRPTNVLAHFRRGVVLSKMKLCGEAKRDFQEAVWYLPAVEYEALTAEADCLIESNKSDLGTPLLEKALTLKPGYAPALKLKLAQQILILEQDSATGTPAKLPLSPENIEQSLKSLLLRNPHDTQATLLLTRLYLAHDAHNSERLAKALAQANSLAESSNFQSELAVSLLIRARLLSGDLEGASAALQRGEKEHPKSEKFKSLRRQLEVEQEAKQRAGDAR